MKAIQITEPKIVNEVELPEPVVSPGEVKIAIKRLGLCGSDLKTYLGQNPMVSYPRIPGHEIAGIIVESGSQVPKKYRTGLSVTVSPYTSCGKCSACHKGRVNCCEYNQTMGVQRDGAAKESITVPHKKVFIISQLSLDQIACLEPLSVGFHAISRAEINQGEVVLIFGCGMVGIGAILAAHYRGAFVIAVDIEDHKLSRAKKLGADEIINSSKTNLLKMVEKITNSYGPDAVIEAVGRPETYQQAIQLVGYAGRVVYIGYSKEPVSYNTKFFVSKELDIKGSRNALDEEIRQVTNMVLESKIDFNEIITHRYPMNEMEKALQYWSYHPEKVIKILMYL